MEMTAVIILWPQLIIPWPCVIIAWPQDKKKLYPMSSDGLQGKNNSVQLCMLVFTDRFKKNNNNKGQNICLQSQSLLFNICWTLLSTPRKTPLHKLFSSTAGQQLWSSGPTRTPPVLPELPQGFHHLYTHIEYECASYFYHHFGSPRRTCLQTGKWSGRHVSCSPGEGSRGSLIICIYSLPPTTAVFNINTVNFNNIT